MKKFFKIFLPIIIIIFAILIFKYLIKHKIKPHKVTEKYIPPLVEILVAKSKNMRLPIEAYGNVIPLNKTILTAEVSGKIIYISPKFLKGEIVKKGEILLKIDPIDYIVNLKKAENFLAQATLFYEKIKNEAEISKKEWKNQKKINKNLPSPSSLRMYIPQLKEAKTKVSFAKIQVKQAKINLKKTIIKAPYTGVIFLKDVDLGQFLRQGEKIGEIYNIKTVEIKIPIPDYEYPWIDFNSKKVKIILNWKNKKYTFLGILNRSENAINPDTRMINIFVRVNNPYKKTPPLFIGSFVKIKFYGKYYKKIFQIPSNLIFKDKYVWVVKDKTLYKKSVSIIKRDNFFCYIVNGLNDNDLILKTHLPYLAEKMKVRIKNNSL